MNGDGKTDLVLQFSMQSLNTAGMLRDDIDLFITGTLNDGTKIEGSDHIFLGVCPRISVHGSLIPGLAWCSRAQMGRGP